MSIKGSRCESEIHRSFNVRVAGLCGVPEQVQIAAVTRSAFVVFVECHHFPSLTKLACVRVYHSKGWNVISQVVVVIK